MCSKKTMSFIVSFLFIAVRVAASQPAQTFDGLIQRIAAEDRGRRGRGAGRQAQGAEDAQHLPRAQAAIEQAMMNVFAIRGIEAAAGQFAAHDRQHDVEHGQRHHHHQRHRLRRRGRDRSLDAGRGSRDADDRGALFP